MKNGMGTKSGTSRRTVGLAMRSMTRIAPLLLAVGIASATRAQTPATEPAQTPDPSQKDSTRGDPLESTNPGAVPMDQLTLKNPQPGQAIVPASVAEKK